MKAIQTILLFLLISQIAYGQKVDVYQRPVQVERSRDFDAIRYKISLQLDLDKKSLAGENEITMVPLNDGLSKCVLDAEYLVVTQVETLAGKSISFEQKDNQVFIIFSMTYNHLDTIQFRVKYFLDKPTLGLRFIDESPTNPRLVSSDCFPNKARQWIPCYDYPNDKVATEMIVTVDDRVKVLSNGRLANVTGTQHPIPDTRSPSTRTWHWIQDLPHSTYLINLSIGDYEVIRDSLGPLPINYWVYHYHAADARRSFRKTPHMIGFFNKLYGYDYPWAKYDQVITPYMGGGAEATTATLLGEGAVMDQKAEQDFSWERVIAHEIAHQWWGDLITLRSWEHTWLNESFGTYSDYLYTRSEFGEDAGAYDLLGKKNQYLNEARNRYIRPIVFTRYNDPGDNFDSHTYPKGANVLHLLRHILGDDTFFRVLNTFLHDNAFKPVDTHDFMKTVKEVSGKNMDWFFEQFIYSPGHLIVEVNKTWDPINKSLKISIIQKQDSLPGVPVYNLPVNLGFFIDGEKLVKEVWLRKKAESFEFTFESEPLLVRFDDGNYLLKELSFPKPMAELLFQAGHDDVVGRLSAIEELKSFSADPAVVREWARLALDDSFWAVRQAALVCLGKFSPKDHLDLIRWAAKDENSKVRQSAVRILGDQKDASLVRFFKKLFKSEDSYLVQSEALRSISKCGGKQQIPFLKEAVSCKSYRDVVGKAAAEAIKSLK
ncbi:MAG: M1 family metallopeptidase [Bacteroidales bacterium]|jgi:aminopeptidase N